MTNYNDIKNPQASWKEQNWITDYAWTSGLAGAITVVILAWYYNHFDILQKGHVFLGIEVYDRNDLLITALLIVTVVMVAVELLRLYLRDPDNFIQVDPLIRSKRYADFFGMCVLHYLTYLVLMQIVLFFFHTAGEYGYVREAGYYQPWFRFLELLWQAILWAGFPYVVLTRALKHNPTADKRDLNSLLHNIVLIAFQRLVIKKGERKTFSDFDKKNIRGLLVKLFFTPLMTVFFLDQFPHFSANIGYMLNGLPDAIANGNYSHATFNGDLFNISVAFIFSIDVALAWCGYVISSRWVDNQTISAEPSMLGWMVCISCYPPFQMYLGLYYSPPADREILGIANLWMVTGFTMLMVMSYLVYMAVTLWFGVRFSNLTHRGIIRKGPFAFVRHPAYASKNLSWWLIMFPTIIYNMEHLGFKTALLQIFGLILMTWVYYLRSITEERHLSLDPAYVEYCKQVKYRFIPGVI